MDGFFSLIINVVLDFYIFILLIRVILQKLGASWHNPLTQFVVKCTEPVIKPVRRLIPGYRGIDYSILCVAFVIEIIQMMLTFLLSSYAGMPGVLGTLVYSVAALCAKTINIFFFATIAWAILSWFSTAQHHPLAEAAGLIAFPLLRLARRVLPLMGSFDLSPILVIVALELINFLVVNRLMALGLRLAV